MALDYSQYGLNTMLQNESSLPAQASRYNTSMDVDADFEAMGASQLATGSFRTNIDVGDPNSAAFVRIDAQNTRIVINDGSDDRIYIGNVS